MGMNTKNDGGSIAEINVTPFVDVMLVLLVIFMIVSTLMKIDESERLVDMDLPVTRHNETSVDINNTDKLILSIDENLHVYVGEEQLVDCSAALTATEVTRFEPCFNDIQRLLGMNARLNEEGELYILADTDIPYGFVVGTLNRIRLAGVERVGMVTNPEYLTTPAAAEP